MNVCENSVKFYEHLEDKDNEILILELCDCNLNEIIDTTNGLDDSMICSIMKQLNNAFKYLNEMNIIHRDIKPKNVLIKYINKRAQPFLAKLSDYGLSRVLDIRTNYFCGTKDYMAPEILLKTNYDNKVDLWSIGVMMYYMHFQEYPFKL